MARQKITQDRISKLLLPEGKKQDFIWDTEVPALACRVTKGTKAFVFQSIYSGKYIRMTIGNVIDWDISEARTEARRLQTLIDQGTDPRQAKARKVKESENLDLLSKREKVSLAEAWPVYIEARKNRWSELSLRDHLRVASRGGEARTRSREELTKPGALAPLLDIKLSDLTADRLRTWQETESQKRPTVAALAFRLLRGFINWAERQPQYANIIPPDACRSKDVREVVPKPKSKDDCLQREQLSAWFSAVRQIKNPVISAYLQALLITGARREEMAALRWVDVDFKWRSLSIADKVEESGRTIPLTPYLASLLMDLKRINEAPPSTRRQALLSAKGENWAPSPWVFASKTSAEGYIAEPRLAHNEALAAADLPHLSLHGLRRSFGTLAEWVECPTGVVAQIMGHKPSAIAEKHYRRRPIDLLRMWHDKIEAWMLEQTRMNAKR